MRIRTALLLALILLLALVPQLALAKPIAQGEAPGESNLGFLFAGFAVVWVAFFAYVFYMSRRERELRREIEELRRELGQRQPGGGPS